MKIFKTNKNLKNRYWLVLLVLIMTGCEEQNKVKEIKLGHGLDTSHPVHKAMVYMSDRLYEKSNGTMTIDIYPISNWDQSGSVWNYYKLEVWE